MGNKIIRSKCGSWLIVSHLFSIQKNGFWYKWKIKLFLILLVKIIYFGKKCVYINYAFFKCFQVTKLSVIRRPKPSTTINNTVNHVLSKQVALQFSAKGKKLKRPLFILKLYGCLIGSYSVYLLLLSIYTKLLHSADEKFHRVQNESY